MSSHSKKLAANRLLQLSKEVSRIATSLAQLSAERTADQPEKVAASGQETDISIEEIDAVIDRSRQRAAYLPQDLIADPVWQMLLALLRAEVMQRRETLSELYAAAGVPETTALRWLKCLEERGLVHQRPDPVDRERVFVELSRNASLALRRWLADSSGEAE